MASPIARSGPAMDTDVIAIRNDYVTPNSAFPSSMQVNLSDTEPTGTIRPPVGTSFSSLELEVIEFLEQDTRPTFVVDLMDLGSFLPGPFQPIFANTALWSSHLLVRRIFGPANTESLQFKSWALHFVKDGVPRNAFSSSYRYCGITWYCWTVRRRLRFISGHRTVTSPPVAIPSLTSTGGIGRAFNPLRQNHAENIEKQRQASLTDLQRCQQIFIGITLLELRNTLDPMFQCGLKISSVISKYRSIPDPTRGSKNHDLLLKSCTEAAQSITHWASYQKKIAEGILATPKLGLDRRRVIPVDLDPIQTIQRLLKMFEPMFMSNEIQIEFHVEDSYSNLDIDCVKADTQMLLQILINLLTNAIERTHLRENRCISVSIGASQGIPEAIDEANISNITGQLSCEDALSDYPTQGHGKKIYLYFSIRDTGSVIGENERDVTHQRLTHSPPERQSSIPDQRLFICSFLAELHRGQIRVEPERGGLGGFTLYIRAAGLNSSPECVKPSSPYLAPHDLGNPGST
ncbi:uncharacterized protein BKA55DRAFT_696252 [Fusarium redolens]|uniref:PAS-like domain-containing protein n=2 Tax=Fusarium TaxID=5506 RepID=A0A9P9G2L1_FUSRE|nr:uncharacterized protein BKA55DRAFT_696252 [Fusarium redolens]KAH7231351.1 hypothetical protein BKA55DRAFT_696252 [Fusarium redolens]